MEENENAGGAGDAASGAQGGDSGSTDDGQSKKTVNFDDHQRALKDLHKHKETAKALQAQLDQEKSSKLKEKEDWKTLAEQKEKEAEELKAKNEKLNHSFAYTQKFSAVHSAAIKAGLRPEAEADLDLLDLDDVECETTDSGKFRVLNADKKIQDLKKLKPHWFQTGKALNINAGGAGGKEVETDLTDSYMGRLSVTDPKKFKELMPRWQEKRAKKA